jgi:predicted acetyltransferase
MDLEIRPITPEETEGFVRATSMAFGHQPSDDDLAKYSPMKELERSLAAYENGSLVGGAHSRSFRMNVPGGQLPAAGVLDVTVASTHRRRGILTALMVDQLKGIHERGEPLAALTASESVIYGRFGYGIATVHETWSIDRPHTAYATPYESRGRLEFVNPEQMRATFPEVYRRAIALRPGAIERPADKWDWIVTDYPPERGGASAYFHVAYYGTSGNLDGYVSYRINGSRMSVGELISVTDEAHAALWRFCFDVDLVSSVTANQRAVDDPLPWMMADPRQLKRVPYDGLWVRLVDLPAALAGRTYASEGRLVLEVRDDSCPWNEDRYALDGGPEGATCRRTDTKAHLALSAADLAAAYLGTVSFTTLSHAGRVEQVSDGALAVADAMFATVQKPWCPFSF